MKMQLSAIIGCSPGFPGDWRHWLPSGSGGCTQRGRAGLPTPGLWGAPRRPATGPPRPEPPWVQQPRVARQGAAPSPAPGDAGSPPCCFRGGEQPREGGGKGAGAARDKPHGARIWANGPAVSGGCAPCRGFSFAARTKGWGSPPGARSVPTERGKGASRISTRLQPCPAARGGETWPCLASPHILHRPPLPTRGAWRGASPSLAMAMGLWGLEGEKGHLGPRSTALGACQSWARGAQHRAVPVPWLWDRRGRGRGEAAGGPPGVPSAQPGPCPATQVALGSLPSRADGAARRYPRGKDTPFGAGLPPPCRSTRHPRPQTHPAPLGGGCSDIPSPAPAGTPGGVTAGWLRAPHRVDERGGPACPTGGSLEGCPPSSPPAEAE